MNLLFSSASKSLRCLVAIASLSIASTALHAATGDELLMAAMPAASVNKQNVKSDVILRAVYQSVSDTKKQAPEIVCAAMSRTRGLAIHKEIVRTAVTALGTSYPKNAVPDIVAAAVRCSSCRTVGTNNRIDETRNANEGNLDNRFNCECAEQFTRVAIEALGANPSKRLVDDIVEAAIRALDGRCADGIVSAASAVAPQYADSIADAGSRVGNGGNNGNNNNFSDADSPVFNATGRPVPAPFVFPPATSGGIVADTTPVN